jgi:hypothetical protein
MKLLALDTGGRQFVRSIVNIVLARNATFPRSGTRNLIEKRRYSPRPHVPAHSQTRRANQARFPGPNNAIGKSPLLSRSAGGDARLEQT